MSGTPARVLRGSSPRVRGAVDQVERDHLECGIIPARAGSSWRQQLTWYYLWDHPRACGEQEVLRRDVRRVVGSSPRVRGAAALVAADDDEVGIIPARAGSRNGTSRPST